jgi:hypothetical protein
LPFPESLQGLRLAGFFVFQAARAGGRTVALASSSLLVSSALLAKNCRNSLFSARWTDVFAQR